MKRNHVYNFYGTAMTASGAVGRATSELNTWQPFRDWRKEDGTPLYVPTITLAQGNDGTWVCVLMVVGPEAE